MLGASQWVIYRIRCGASEALPTTLRVRHDAVVADLAVALGFEPLAALSVDGQRVRPEDELREIGLCQGSVVTSVRPGPAQPVGAGLDSTSIRPESGQLVLIVRGGLDAGRRLVLGPADALVGRAPACDLVLDDPAVALLHGVVRRSGPDTVSFELLADADLDADPDTHTYADAAAGTEASAATVTGAVQVRRLEVGQQLQVGRYRLELAREDLRQRPAGLDPRLHRTTRGTLVINRPPRPGRSPSGGPLSVPQPPDQVGATPLAVVAIVLPLVLSMVMVAVTGSWLFALLTILSPLLAISNWWSGRRSARRRGRATTRVFAAEVASFERALTLARQQADAAAEQRAVDLAEVARRAMLPARSLWERRLGEADVLHVVLGRAQRAASLPLVWPGGQPPSFGSEQGRYSAGTRPGLHPAVEEIVVRANRSANRPVELDLAEDGVVGIVGDPAAARAVARSLVLQLVVHHGPADLATVFVAGERHCHWQWMEWLPHRLELEPDPDTDGASCGLTDRSTAGTRAVSRLVAAASPRDRSRQSEELARRLLLVVDDEEALTARGTPTRAVLRGEAGPVVAIVLAASADRLPATCRLVVHVGADARATLTAIGDGSVVSGVDSMGASAATAASIAAALARYEDADISLPGAGLPDEVGLLELLAATERDLAGTDLAGTDLAGTYPAGTDLAEAEVGADTSLAATLVRRWVSAAEHRSGRPRAASLPASLGVGTQGPLVVDLVADGPHALVAGTTGSGKSELLRSWILALAVGSSPRHLNFVLIDFKGGSAFDACAQLPHTVAVVTDLDDELAERALRCLQAELGYRERVLRAAGVTDLADLPLAGSPPRPVPGPGDAPSVPGDGGQVELARLVVVIDEFATLAAELPGFLDALVGIAQRGRSLGIHLILATQRPAGVLSEHIKANTNVRIALRVQDRADSQDVIGRPDAAELDRRWPGRAYVRLGRNDVTAVQTAYSGTRAPHASGAVELLDAPHRPPGAVGGAVPGLDSSDLERLVAVVRLVARRLSLPSPRLPWPAPLPFPLDLETFDRLSPRTEVHSSPSAQERAQVPFLLLDDPDGQRREVGGWQPEEGNLLVYGTTGSGATTALVALGLALARRTPPDQLELHLVGEDGAFQALAGLIQVGSVIRRDDRERIGRLLHHLETELRRRRGASGATQPEVTAMIVVIIDGLGSLVQELSEGAMGGDDADRLARLMADGPAHGLYTVASAEHATAVRYRTVSGIAQRLVLRLADPLEARQLGVAAGFGPPGRGRRVSCGRSFQVVWPGPIDEAVAQIEGSWSPSAVPRRVRIGRLAERVERTELSNARAANVSPSPDAFWLPLGIGGMDLAAQGWWLHPGDGLLVVGPSRSGRSNLLAAAVTTIREQHPAAALIGVATERSPLARAALSQWVRPAELASLLAHFAPSRIPRSVSMLLIDDAEAVEDPAGVVTRALACGWVVVAAGRNDALRAAYGHWSRVLRGNRTGLLLRPDLDLDGDLLGVRLPRRSEAPLGAVGRGFLVQEGEVTLIQTARNDSDG